LRGTPTTFPVGAPLSAFSHLTGIALALLMINAYIRVPKKRFSLAEKTFVKLFKAKTSGFDVRIHPGTYHASSALIVSELSAFIVDISITIKPITI
jgi:hypothetical protein